MGDYYMQNQRFGRLIVKEIIFEGKKCICKCVCDCGKVKDIYKNNLIWGRTKSCGCLRKELMSKRATKHGMSSKKVYVSWYRMLRRCYVISDIGYKDYGNRGIKVCERWHKLENFYEDMGDRPKGKTLARINNEGNYELNNCRWADLSIQNRNQRTRKDNTSGIKGVNLHKRMNRWVVRVQRYGKRITLGYFKTKEEAIQTRKAFE